MGRWLRRVVLVLAIAALPKTSGAEPPSVLFILLDTVRADHLSAWGYSRGTTPSLDALAASGVRFRRHFANSHATRPSLPQLMTGRYYHQNILGPFTPDRHPREVSFSQSDPTAMLLPAIFRRHNYQTLGVSTHWWVIKGSPLGESFEQLELIPVDPVRAYAEAAQLVDRALVLWRARDRSRPLFLYLHFMDAHLPRFLPEGEPRFPVDGFDWRQRFRPSGEPLFGRERRRWARSDAGDFTDLDRRHFAGVYDTRLSYMDEQLGRLLNALRADDPELRQTLVVIVADHGEELGEEGRTEHTDSLAESVQHIPWIVAGGGVAPGQQAERFTENIDVAPTVLALAGLSPPPGVTMDGRAQLTPDGQLCRACGKAAAYYAWETYSAIRTRRYLLRQGLDDSFRARCLGAETLYRVRGALHTPLDPAAHPKLAARLRRRLARRLGKREHTFLARRYGPPQHSFFLAPDFWRLAPGATIACVAVGPDTDRRQLNVPGWLWSGRGVARLQAGSDGYLPIMLSAPDGEYRVDAGVVPIARMPWFFGFERWLRKSFLPADPSGFVPLGAFRATAGTLSLPVPSDVATRNHIVGFRLSPPGATPEAAGARPSEEELRRLRALGYVQ